MVHSEIMFLELIQLYLEMSQDNTLELEKLERAFYTLEELLGNHLGISVEYVFDEELEKFDTLCEGIISLDEHTMYFDEDNSSELLEEIVTSSFCDDYYDFDSEVADIVHNIYVYHDLEIEPNLSDYQDILNASLTIYKDYQILADQTVFNGKTNSYMLLFIQSLVSQFESMYAELEYDDVAKLKVVLAYLNGLYLLDGDDDFLNSDWHIILFSNNERQIYSLSYKRLARFVENEDKEYDNKNELSSEEIPSFTFYLDEIEFFLKNYLHTLHQYLKGVGNLEVKQILTTKEYMLIARDEETEKYFLEHGTLDGKSLTDITQNLITETSFNSLYLTVIDAMDAFKKKDGDIHSNEEASMIVSALFIRAFLDLCINQEMIKDVYTRISDPNYYSNSDYQIATSFIDEIIFKEKGYSLNIKL